MEQTAVKTNHEKNVTACKRQSQALCILIAPGDITAAYQGTKGADVYRDDRDSLRKGRILSSVLCLLRQGSV